MAMDGGSVNLDGNGDPQGSGLSRDLYDDYIAKLDLSGFPAASQITGKQSIADLCDSLGQVVVTYLAANADVRITASDSGLQQTPNPNDVDTDTQGPSVDKVLSGALE